MVEQNSSGNDGPASQIGRQARQERPRQERSGAERRAFERYPIVAPVRWANGSGVARDISAGGLLFETDTPLAPGGSMKLAVIGEAEKGDNKRVYALCDVVVVRVVPPRAGGGKCEIAVAFDSVRLH